jgi:hypothetical protein
MFLLIAGMALLALGLFSGVVLVLAPLGLAPWSPMFTLCVLFPLFSILGYVLFVGDQQLSLKPKGVWIVGLGQSKYSSPVLCRLNIPFEVVNHPSSGISHEKFHGSWTNLLAKVS